MEYHAHTPNDHGEWHALAEHIRAVAHLAREFAVHFDAGALAYAAGLLHDVGKYHPDFQKYLADCYRDPTTKHRGPDHKAAGALMAQEHGLPLAMLTLPLQGHHGGLHDRGDFQEWYAKKTIPAERVRDAIALALADLPELRDLTPPPMPMHLLDAKTNHPSPTNTEFFLRMLFSALVDADYLDTERHFTGWKATARTYTLTLADLLARFNALPPHVSKPPPSRTVRDARDAMFATCVTAAAQLPGFFRLTMPTGGGKTRSGMAFALNHAIAHGKRRVIVAVPFITITQQTAKAYRDIFEREGDDHPAVLEHHSAATARNEADEADPDYRRDAQWARLAAENWDAPVIVTTTVQLFESLFAAGTSPCRKLHRLANSVIILDEAQALPPKLLPPILDALRELVAHYGATVVFSTATQPAFEQIAAFREIAATEIVPDHARYFAALTRVTYEWRIAQTYPFDAVAEWIRDATQALAVLNTKGDALALLAALDDPDALHLSTLLCGAHRMAVIVDVRQRLSEGKPCRLVATQVIEAGVDLDFPLVLRALGPLDSVIQAAGRCNREGNLHRGRVIVFRPETEKNMPQGAYHIGAKATKNMIERGAVDADNPDTARDYFRNLYGLLNLDQSSLAVEIARARAAFNYPEVQRLFQMIDDATETVVITQYGTTKQREQVGRLLTKLRGKYGSVRETLRELQPYTVSVRARLIPEYQRRGLITEVLPSVWEWHGKYHKVSGLFGEGLDTEKFIV